MGCARRRVAAAAVLVGLTLPVAFATPGGATAPTAPLGCARVQVQYRRIVAQNAKVKTAYEKAAALQARLNRTGRARLGQRLNARLAYLQSLHTTLVARVAALAARVQGRCSIQAPTLPSL